MAGKIVIECNLKAAASVRFMKNNPLRGLIPGNIASGQPGRVVKGLTVHQVLLEKGKSNN